MPDWFRPWTEIEEAATALRSYQQLAIDGLLQIPAYARAILQAGMPPPTTKPSNAPPTPGSAATTSSTARPHPNSS